LWERPCKGGFGGPRLTIGGRERKKNNSYRTVSGQPGMGEIPPTVVRAGGGGLLGSSFLSGLLASDMGSSHTHPPAPPLFAVSFL
jgi:hypothetical protein